MRFSAERNSDHALNKLIATHQNDSARIKSPRCTLSQRRNEKAFKGWTALFNNEMPASPI